MGKEETLEYVGYLEEKNLALIEKVNERPERAVEKVVEVTTQNSSQSETIGEIAKALVKCQKEFKAVGKNSQGYSYNYADLTSILEYAQPIYTKHGLAITQHNVSKMFGKTVVAGVKTMLLHESGEWMASEMYAPVTSTKQNSLQQNIGITVTYFRRYGIQSVLGLSTEDNDGKLE